MKKHTINNLIVEVTRRCNMECAHCLRGCAESNDIDHAYIIKLVSQLDYIRHVTFSGGEPSLNVPAIDSFLSECKRLGVGIGGFYIATNGLKIKEDFVISCLRLYAYCDEKEMCGVHVSNDAYHACEGQYNTKILDGLSFFSRKHEQEAFDYKGGQYLIAEGNGALHSDRINEESSVEDLDDFDDADIYLNCNGVIINGCDWSYASQDEGKYDLCKVGELSAYIESLEN